MTLIEVARMTENEARKYFEKIRWPEGPVCPHCGGMDKAYRIKGKSTRPGLYKCGHCRKPFTVTVGTVMQGSHISLKQWILAYHLMCSSKKGFSALQLQRNLDLKSYKSAWHLAHRIRLAMKEGYLKTPLKGTVEVDETYVGGKTREGRRGRGSERKSIVMALVERDGKSVSKPVGRVDGDTLKGEIRNSVDRDARIMTDEWGAYRGIGDEFKGGHHVIKHSSGQYSVNGINTNTAESFFALLKRGVVGTFHHVSREHLSRYCDEFSFRWNHRKVDDGLRTALAIQGGDGKRLLYKSL